MGRHRSDPRALIRYAIAAVLVVLIAALLIAGGIALYGAITPKAAHGAGGPGDRPPAVIAVGLVAALPWIQSRPRSLRP